MDGTKTRRGVMKGVLGLTCASCASTVSGNSTTAIARQDDSATDWNRLDVDGYPFSIRYRSGYQSDAERVEQWAIFGYQSVQAVYSHELDEPVTFDIFPAAEYTASHGTMTYYENSKSIEMVTPSEYDGNYSDTALFYRHGAAHEYAHAAQKDAMSFHTHANWLMEGFAEAVAVYYTDDDIYDTYHTNHHRAMATRRDIERGYGYVLGVNEYVYRGSMHLLKFMFDTYGSQSVGEIFEQDAESAIEAMQMRLGITPLDLEAGWLAYAQREFGGDYTEQIERLGGEVEANLSVDTVGSYEPGQIRIQSAVVTDSAYRVVVFDESMAVLGQSDTISAGESVDDLAIQLNETPVEPAQLTVRLHQATDTEYGAPVEVAGNTVDRLATYLTSQAAIRFTAVPEPDDTSVSADAAVAQSYDTDERIGVYVMEGDSTSYSDSLLGDHNGIPPGSSLTDLNIGLGSANTAVPLESGQTITAALMDLEDDVPIAESIITVGESGSQSDPSSQTQESTVETQSSASQESTVESQSSATQSRQRSQTESATGVSDTATSTADGSGFGIVSALLGAGGLTEYLRRKR